MEYGILIGINGVSRESELPYMGRYGVEYDIWDGYVGVNGAARQFLVDGFTSILNGIYLKSNVSLYIYQLKGSSSTEYESSIVKTITATLDELSKMDLSDYGISISYSTQELTDDNGVSRKALKSITATATKIGYKCSLDANCRLVLRAQNRYDYTFQDIPDQTNVVTKVGYSLSFSCRKGEYGLFAFGQMLKDGTVGSYTSGTVDFEKPAYGTIGIDAGIYPDSNSGSAVIQMTFNEILIDGKKYYIECK